MNLWNKAFAGALFVAAMTIPASASIILQTSNEAIGNQVWGGVGVEFTVNAAVTVSQLGIYDSNQNGLAALVGSPLTAQLWSGGSVIASATFWGADPGVLDVASKYRFKSIAPLLLAPGNYILAGYGWTASDQEHNSNVGGTPDTFNNGGGLLSYVNSLYTTSSSAPAGTPLTQSTGPLSPNYFSAANMDYDAASVPEPTTIFLMAAGLAGLAGARLKSKNRAA